MSREPLFQPSESLAVVAGVHYDLALSTGLEDFCHAASKHLMSCPFCGAKGRIQKKGNSISYWQVRCETCRVFVNGTMAIDAFYGWNRRPNKTWQPLGEHSFLLPAGQPFQHVMVHENGEYTFTDYIDGEVAKEFTVKLGRFRFCVLAPE